MITDDLNVKNFQCLFQVLDFEDCSKRFFELNYSWDHYKDHNNVVDIKKQYNAFLTMKQKT